jgi:putative glutamine amidotransferase
MKIPYAPGPVIGIPVRMNAGRDNHYLNRCFADSVAASGGTPLLIPLLNDPGPLKSMVRAFDGILLSGSNSDVDPSLYGAEREPECGPCQPLRDQTDFFLLEAAHEQRIPVLAICFGIQSLNVFKGGTLIQDLPSRVGTAVTHGGSISRFAHTVEFARDSILEDLAGGTVAQVNSSHHQALEILGAGLEVIARAPDGVIEAVVGTREQWILGVQWHPEKSFEYDEFSRRIFGTFLRQCRNGRPVDEGSDQATAGAGRGRPRS